MPSPLIQTPSVILQPHFFHLFLSAPEAKACMPYKEEEMSGSVSDSKVHCFFCLLSHYILRSHVCSCISCGYEIFVSGVCGTFTNGYFVWQMASSKAATRGAFIIGCPSDLKKCLCFHSAPKSYGQTKSGGSSSTIETHTCIR